MKILSSNWAKLTSREKEKIEDLLKVKVDMQERSPKYVRSWIKGSLYLRDRICWERIPDKVLLIKLQQEIDKLIDAIFAVEQL